MSSTAKNNILKKMRMALTQPTPLPFPEVDKPVSVFQPQQQDALVEFAEQFTQLQGKFSYCQTKTELAHNLLLLYAQHGWTKIFTAEDKWKDLIPAEILSDDVSGCDAAITSCEALVARTGSIVLSSAGQGRIPSVYAPVHICIAGSRQLIFDIGDALTLLQKNYGNELPSMISFATGPSRTADIEKTLVVGVHGPGEVYCFVAEEDV